MKKNFAYLAITLFMGLFASCSQENDPTTSDSRNKLVNISAELPKEFAQTRTVPSADGHYLRCILEITNENGDRCIEKRNWELKAMRTVNSPLLLPLKKLVRTTTRCGLTSLKPTDRKKIL